MKKGDSVIIILLGIFGLILLFELLITFKVISLSSISKLLPTKTGTSASPSSTLPFTMICPNSVSPCAGKDMFKNKVYAGIGFTVRKDNPIFAAISGDIIYRDRSSSQSSVIDDAVIIGKGNYDGYMAVYSFVGEKLGKELTRGITANDPIAIASSGSLIDFDDSKRVNLVFRFQRIKGAVVYLSPSNFK